MTLRQQAFNANASGSGPSPQDSRLAFAGLISGSGVISGMAVTGSSSGPSMKYVIAAGSCSAVRGTAASDGYYLMANDGNLTVDSSTNAPVSGTRWDLIYVAPRNAFDGGFGDANSTPIAGVLVGVAGSFPVKPYGAGQGAGGTSLPAGALVIAESLVGTNIANASLATIGTAPTTAGPSLGMQTITDWNTASKTGFYFAAGGAANEPSNDNNAGVAFAAPDGRVVQIVWRLTSWSASPQPQIAQFQRIYTGSAWSPWAQIIGPPLWTNITLSNTTGTQTTTPGYYQPNANEVYLKGAPSGSWTTSTQIGALPSGARPPGLVELAAACGISGGGRSKTTLEITSAGVINVIPDASQTVTWVSFDNIHLFTQ